MNDSSRQLERQLWQQLSASPGYCDWDIWHRWNRLCLQRLYPAMGKVMQCFDLHYQEQKKRHQARQERLQRGLASDSQLTYGETSWLTFDKILRTLNIQPHDRFVELGCGNGQLCFLIRLQYGIPVLGIDKTCTFIETAQAIASELSCGDLAFQARDFLDFDFSQATLYYLTATCFAEGYEEQVLERLAQAPSQSRIAIATRPLTAPFLKLICYFPGWFNWGRDEVRVYRKV